MNNILKKEFHIMNEINFEYFGYSGTAKKPSKSTINDEIKEGNKTMQHHK